MDPRRHRHRLRAVLSKLNNETVAKAVLFFVERLRFFDIQPAVQVKYGNFLFVFTPLRGGKNAGKFALLFFVFNPLCRLDTEDDFSSRCVTKRAFGFPRVRRNYIVYSPLSKEQTHE